MVIEDVKTLVSEQNAYVGRKIKELRISKGILQRELGDKIGVKNNTISAYERGIVEVPHSKLIEIAKFLGVKYTELLPLELENNKGHESLEVYIERAKETLTLEQGSLLERIIEKSLSLPEAERKKFFENIRFAVEYFERGNQ